jgi:hypothetical protein
MEPERMELSRPSKSRKDPAFEKAKEEFAEAVSR